LRGRPGHGFASLSATRYSHFMHGELLILRPLAGALALGLALRLAR
jgi:hypothetical protein